MTCDTAPLIPSPVQPQETTICVALELSRSTWLVGINLPHLVRNPGMVPNETICGVRRFHRIVFQRCVRCPPILHESFKKLGQPRLTSQSATRSEHRYRLQ